MKTEILSTRIDGLIKEMLREEAQIQRRSLTNMIEVMILDYVERQVKREEQKKLTKNRRASNSAFIC